MSYRHAPMGDSAEADIQRGIGFIQNPVAATVSFLTEQLLGSIFGESTHEKYLRWLGGYQAMEAAGRKRSRLAKHQIARSAYYGGTRTATRLSNLSPGRLRLLAMRAAARRRSR